MHLFRRHTRMYHFAYTCVYSFVEEQSHNVQTRAVLLLYGMIYEIEKMVQPFHISITPSEPEPTRRNQSQLIPADAPCAGAWCIGARCSAFCEGSSQTAHSRETNTRRERGVGASLPLSSCCESGACRRGAQLFDTEVSRCCWS